jgi:hypothetical protein
MTEKESALYSHYIIDGVRMDMTPADLLEECMEYEDSEFQSGFNDIIDESTEPPLSSFEYEDDKEHEYLQQTLASSVEEREFRMLYPEHFTKLQIAKALLSRLWSEGHFKLGNLKLWAQWEWNTRPLGNMAAFYRSVEATSQYIYGLGVNLEDYLFIEGDEGSNVKFFSWLDEEFEDNGLFRSSPYESLHPWISEERKCPSTVIDDPDSWIIYIPFDTCGFKLGDSLLTQVNGYNGGKAPDINDPDYFIDCYEVVRELVEDEVVMAGVNVADGGLITAAQRMCGDLGIDMDINGILSSYQNDGRSRILFGEVPLLKYCLNSLFCQYLQRETSLYSIISGLRLFLYCIRILYLNDVALFRSFCFLIWRHC